jgi:hypothetical protein
MMNLPVYKRPRDLDIFKVPTPDNGRKLLMEYNQNYID